MPVDPRGGSFWAPRPASSLGARGVGAAVATVVGAACLAVAGPFPVVVGVTPIGGDTPWLYLISAFPLCGALGAEEAEFAPPLESVVTRLADPEEPEGLRYEYTEEF